MASAPPVKLATGFTASIAALATLGAALVAFRVGSNATGAVTDEKRALLAVEGPAVMNGGSVLGFDVTNHGLTAAQWIELRVAIGGGPIEAAVTPILKPGDGREVRIRCMADEPAIVDVRFRGFRDRVRRQRCVLTIAGNGRCVLQDRRGTTKAHRFLRNLNLAPD